MTDVFNVKGNMSFFHYIRSHLLLRNNNPITRFMLYRKTYRNHLEVIAHMKRTEFPFEARLRNGRSLMITHPTQVYANLSGLDYDLENDIVTVDGAKFYGGINNGEIANIFIKKQFDPLPINGRVVVDIGANIGDSPVYFALKGAQRVIALEPFPKNYETAKKNITLNKLTDKIIFLMAACSSTKGFITIDPEEKSDIKSQVHESERGIKVPTMTLEDIINANSIESAVLKMDCEGCEYDAILSSSTSVLQRFTHMHLEYHYGYKNLKTKLEDSGFTVSVTSPRISFIPPEYAVSRENNSKLFVGRIFAQLLN